MSFSREDAEMTKTEWRKRHRLLIKLGFRPRFYWHGYCHHYNKGGFRWRINMHGDIQRSCCHEDFDRWANSTEQTWTWQEFQQEMGR
jgi:hypothetical protein